MYKLDEKSISTFIKLVKERPELYDGHHPYYKRMEFKEKTWNHIAAEINTDVYVCKCAWKSMRDSFTKNLRYAEDHPDTKTSRKRYKYFDELYFLKEHCSTIKMRKRTREAAPAEEGNCDETTSSQIDEDDPLMNVDIESILSESEWMSENSINKLIKNEDSNDLISGAELEEEPLIETTALFDVSADDSESIASTVNEFVIATRQSDQSENDDSKTRQESINCFFLNMATIVKQYNLNISELAKLQCKLLTFTTLELEKHKHNSEQPLKDENK